MRFRFVFLVVAVLGFGAGCDSRTAPASTPAESSIRITRITPDVATPLKVGQEVSLAADVEYHLADGSGTVTLVIQDGTGQRVGNQHIEVVSKGSGKVALKSAFTVPETTALIVYTPLNPQGQGATSIVDTRAYKVLPGG